MIRFYRSLTTRLPFARWLGRAGSLVGLVLYFGTALSGWAQSVQLNLNVSTNVPNSTSVASCSAFNVNLNYGVVSAEGAAVNARITLPLKGLAFNSVSGPDVTSSAKRGAYPNDTLLIVLRNPLPAGQGATATISMQFPCGTVCTGTSATIQPYFDADNATGRATTSPISLTSVSLNPTYRVSTLQTSYDATTRRGTYTVRVTPTTTPTNFMALVSPVMSMTVPANVTIRPLSMGGTRGTIPSGLPSGTFTPTSTTSTGSGGTKIITWTNLPIFYRGGTFDVSGLILEYPVGQFPSGSVVTLNSSVTGVLSGSTCGLTATSTNPFALTLIDPKPTATGCSGQTMLFGLNNPWNALFVGKANQSRFTVPLVNTGNVALDNIAYIMPIPTNELVATQVYGTGTTGASGLAYYRTNLDNNLRLLGTVGQGIAARSFTLVNGEYVTQVRVEAATLAIGRNMSANVQFSHLSPLRSGTAVNAAPLNTFMASTANQTSCFGGFTCATVSATVTAEYSGTSVLSQTACTSSRVMVQPTAGIQNFQKTLPVTASSYVPGQVFPYRLRFAPVTAGDSLRNFVLTDVLPANLDYAGNLKYSTNASPPAVSGLLPTGTSLPQFSVAGKTLTWSWAALPAPNNRINSTADHYIYFDVRIREATPIGTLTNCATATGTGMFTVAAACVNITVSPQAKVNTLKLVKGDLDRNYNRFPTVGHTTDGGKSDYRFVLINSGNVAFKNFVIVDILPWIGDQAVAANFPRESEWRPQLTQPVRFYAKAAADSAKVTVGTISTPANVTVSYSNQTNPCRDEFSPPYNPVGCVVNSWSVTPPANLSTVQAIKVNIAGPLAAGDTLVFGVDMRSPPNTALNAVAWNSFAYQAARNDNNELLAVAEPNKVGIDVKRFPAIGNYVWQDLNGNGRQDEPPAAGANGIGVQLWSPGGDGQRGTADDFLVGSRQTANDSQGQPGYYRFDSLFVESYYLRFAAPVGQAFTRQAVASVPDSLNSDPDGFTGWTVLTALEPNEQDFDWDAGLCTIPNAGSDQLLCSPVSSVNLPDATGVQTWTAVATNPPGAAIDPQTGQVTGLGSGLYRFVLTAGGGCVDTVLVDRRPPARALAPSVVVCAGESITLTAQSAGGSATYLWTGPGSYSASGEVVLIPNATPARSGSYTLTVTDSGCVSATTVSVTVNPLPSVTATNGGPLSCARPTVSLTANGSGSSYAWSGPGSFSANTASTTTNLPGTYTVVATSAAGCTNQAITVVGEDNTPPQLTTQTGACVPATNQYTATGTVIVSNPGPATLIVTDTDGVRSVSVAVVASQTSVAYSLSGLNSDGASHTLTASFASTACSPATLTYTAPASCSCVLSVTMTAGACLPNGTFRSGSDDFFLLTLAAANTVPGVANRFEVVLNTNADGTGGTVLDAGGTVYGQSATVGSSGEFRADNATILRLTVRDVNSPGCRRVLLTPSVAPCSSCDPPPCLPAKLTKAIP